MRYCSFVGGEDGEYSVVGFVEISRIFMMQESAGLDPFYFGAKPV